MIVSSADSAEERGITMVTAQNKCSFVVSIIRSSQFSLSFGIVFYIFCHQEWRDNVTLFRALLQPELTVEWANSLQLMQIIACSGAKHSRTVQRNIKC